MKSYKIAIIGQGYIGLPLALEFANCFPVLDYDINSERTDQLNNRVNIRLKADVEKFNAHINLYKESEGKFGYKASADLNEISLSNIFIVTVPTPLDKYNAPDLKPQLSASKMLEGILKKENTVIFDTKSFLKRSQVDARL